ncbi:MAG: class I SAM-dependent methyltransferase [Polyangiaceae bacterium]
MTQEIALDVPQARFYDLGAWLYDFVVGSRLYHHFAWGMSPGEHTEFARRALNEPVPGPILDAGCGSLLFTAPCYRRGVGQLTLLDASQGMLARARRRFDAPDAHWLQADLRALPLDSESFAKVFHFGVLHCLDDAKCVLSELFRVTRPGGRLFLSCLVLGRPRGDAFLRRLSRAGHVAAPRTANTVVSAVEGAGFMLRKHEPLQRGSFLFIEAERIARDC